MGSSDGTTVEKPNSKSSLHLGVFLGARLVGAYAVGRPTRSIKGNRPSERHQAAQHAGVSNRMAMTWRHAKNTEKPTHINYDEDDKKSYPAIEWASPAMDVSVGDGTTYRASGTCPLVPKNAGL